MSNDKLYLDKKLKDKAITCSMLKLNLPTVVKKGFCLARRIKYYKYNKTFKQHYNKLEELKDKHKGERCFVVGMGPSLDKTRFDLIKNEHFIVSNNFYQGMDRFGIKPEYWCVADDAVFDIHDRQLLKQDTTLFLTDEACGIFLKNKNYYMDGIEKEPITIKILGNTSTWLNFSKDLRNGAYGGMVIYSGLQVAFHLGFKEIYLLGCDCTETKGIHFDGADSFNLQGIPVQDSEWLPTLKKYEVYKRLFEKEGRTIYNATPGGNLEVFERRSLEDIV